MRPTTIRRMAAAIGCAAILSTTAVAVAPPASAGTVACPAPAGNARLVRFIYLNILFRCPEEAALTYWTGRLDGGMARWSFAEAVDTSEENLAKNNVVPIYGDLLHRQPTADELATWTDFIRSKHQDAALLAAIVSSDEYYDAMTTPTANGHPGAKATAKDQAWLDAAYNGILDRSPDQAGAAHFQAVLGSPSTAATRLKVAKALEYSQENARGWTGAVYFAGLNRPPDGAGFGYWVGWLTGPGQWRTFSMWTHILSSNEGYARAQTQPTPSPEQARRTIRSFPRGG